MHLILYDIGAAGTIPEHWEKKLLRKNTTIYAFDENKDKNKNIPIKNFKIKFLSTLLSNGNYKKHFYVLNRDTGSSFYKVNRKFIDYISKDYFDLKKKILVKTKSLNWLIVNKKIKKADLMKLDTQGSELEILKGYKKNLNSLIGIETEIEFEKIYERQPTFSAIDNFLRKNQFELIDIKPARVFHSDRITQNYYWNKYGGADNNYDWLEKIVACDGLYLKNINWLKKQNINVIYKYFEILYVYNFFDRAFSLLENFKKEKIINSKHYFFLKNQFELKNKKPFYKIFFFKFIRKIKFIIFIINHLCKKHLPLIIKNLVYTNKSWHNY
jgi:FkbM family methyltransferase